MFQKIYDFVIFEFNKRPLFYIVIFFVAGVAAAEASLFQLYAALALFFASILGAVLFRKFSFLFLVLLAFFAATPFFAWRTSYPAEHIKNYTACFGWPRAEITGRIAADPDIVRSDSKVVLLLEAESFKVKGLPKKDVTGFVRVTLKEEIDYGDLNYGDRVSVYARFHVPREPKNPGEFNYKRYLERKGIFLYGTADLQSGDSFERLGEGKKNAFISWTIKLKHRLLRIIAATTPGEAAYLIQGILIGEEDALDGKRKLQFRDTGTFHILAVSGFNVALVVATFFFVLQFLGYKKKLSAGISIVFVCVFCFVTGCCPSVVRASIICSFALLAMMLERDTDIVTLLALSALLMVLYNPNTLFDIGFQLSYISTLGLIFLVRRLESYMALLPRLIAGAISVTVAAQLFVSPVTVYYFNSFSTLTLPTNLAIAPFVWFSTVAGFIQAGLGLIWLPLGSIVGWVNSWSVFALFKIVEFFSSFSFAVLRLPAPGFFFLLFYYSTVLTLVYFKKLYNDRPVLLVSLLATLSLVLWLNVFVAAPELNITVMSLRRGNAVLVTEGKGVVLYAEGALEDYELERKILPLMHAKGQSRLDILICDEALAAKAEILRPKEVIKLSESGKKILSVAGPNGKNITAGGKTYISGEGFYIDKEKLVYGNDRITVFFKDVRKEGAFTLKRNDGGLWTVDGRRSKKRED